MKLQKLLKNLLILLLLPTIASCKRNVQGNKQVQTEQINAALNFEIDSFDLKIEKLTREYSLPGVSLAFITNGHIHSTRPYGVLQNSKEELVDAETMFSVGSISKVVHALIILKLVDMGKLDLDVDVNSYLKNWKVQENDYSKDIKVTLRRILSHTAGFSVTGFDDYLPGETIPNLLQILNGVSPAKNEKIELVHAVGSKFQYSGGGMTVAQKVVEDVMGLPYHKAAEKLLINPLGLQRTTFENPLPSSWNNVAKAHNENGSEVAMPRGYQTMPETAASGLWTSASDLAKILIALHAALEQQENDLISFDLATLMVTNVDSTEWGLGPKINMYKGRKLIEHTGSNDSYNSYFCFYPKEGTGYIACTNGSNGLDFLMEHLKLFDGELQKIEDYEG